MALKRIVSGGQTGADRGGLDAAIELGIDHGGWCPKHRRAEDGPIPEHYRLAELSSAEYAARTQKNVIDSDGTVLFTRGAPTGGSALTRSVARDHERPLLHLDLDELSEDAAARELAEWVAREQLEVLNVAGTRESGCPGIADTVHRIVIAAFG